MDRVIFNTHDVVLLMTAYQCILFAILLVSANSEKRLSNIFLALFLLQQAAIPLDILISFGAEFRYVALEFSPNLFYVFGFGYWLEAPLLLWYTRSLVYKNYRLTRWDLFYLLPFFAYLIYQIFFYYGLEFTAKKQLQETYDLFIAPQYMNYVTLFRELFRVVLGILCLVEIRRYRRHLKHNYSAIEKLDLSWLTMLVVGFTVLRIWSVLVIFLVILSVVYGIATDFEIMGLIGNYTTFVLVSMLIFFSLRHSSVCEGLDFREERREEPDRDNAGPGEAEFLRRWMAEHKPYLTPGLTLERLAQQVNMPARGLSSLINRQFDCNFFEFINCYRVEEAKRLLAEDTRSRRKTVLDIMYEVGFNSKATFNTLFKKKVNMTPSEYRKSLQKQEP